MKSFLVVFAFCVPVPWQQAALWEGSSCRTKAPKALRRISSALVSPMSSVHPCFIASLHCLSCLLPHPEQVGTEVWFSVPGRRTPPEWHRSSPPRLCSPLIFLFLISCFSQSCSSSSIISHNASIHPSFALQWFSCLFVSFSLSFPHRLLPDKENSCTFMCFP